MKEIFIVEDDHDIREMIQFLLTDQNYEVQAFATAEAFNDEIMSHKPDLILLDIRLPDGNGSDICEGLKAEEKTASIPVILMSAHVDQQQLKAGCADDFIPKPFDIDEFADRIRRLLN